MANFIFLKMIKQKVIYLKYSIKLKYKILVVLNPMRLIKKKTIMISSLFLEILQWVNFGKTSIDTPYKCKTNKICQYYCLTYSIVCSLIMAGIGDLNDSTIKTGLELISTLIKMIIGDENINNKNADRIKREIKVCTKPLTSMY